MSSPQPVRVPERHPEPVEMPVTSRAPEPAPERKKPRFTIKLKGYVPF